MYYLNGKQYVIPETAQSVSGIFSSKYILPINGKYLFCKQNEKQRLLHILW